VKTIARLLFYIIFIWLLSACGTPQQYPTSEFIPTEFVPTEPPAITNVENASIAPELNSIAPNFTLNDTHGNTYDLWGLRGYPVLVNFWATWCGPCLEELPALQAIFNRYQSDGLIILAINGDGESFSDIDNYRQENGLSFPLLIDTDESAPASYQIGAFPTSFFVDRNGIIQYINYGSLDEQGFDDILNSTILVGNSSYLAIDLPGNVWSVDISEPHVYNYSILSDDIFSNFTVQTDVEINNNAHEYHGLFFRQQDDKNFYSFRITPDGFFEFDVWHSGDYSFDTILGPTQSDYIYRGVGQTNTLKVVTNNENFDLYINGQYVGSISDTNFQSGKVGVISCTCDGSNATSATFYNFSLIDQP